MHKKIAITIAIVSIFLVTIGFLLDNDEPYPNVWQTVFEFSWLTLFTFLIFSVLYGIGYGIYKVAERIR